MKAVTSAIDVLVGWVLVGWGHVWNAVGMLLEVRKKSFVPHSNCETF
jgi:hypothetical protein